MNANTLTVGLMSALIGLGFGMLFGKGKSIAVISVAAGVLAFLLFSAR
jgi:uncharacterized membrane protein YjjP (DUF1212 family)